jgi:hypothetical protein
MDGVVWRCWFFLLRRSRGVDDEKSGPSSTIVESQKLVKGVEADPIAKGLLVLL